MSETEDNLRRKIYELGCKLRDYDHAPEAVARIGAELVDASGVCDHCKGEAAPSKLRQYTEAVDRWLQSARLYPRINHEPLLPDFRAFDVGEAEASRIIFEARRECARMSEEPYAI